eukprot:767664-Hanusia_phi.AAC.1
MINAEDYHLPEEAIKAEYDVEACEWKKTTRKIMIGKDFFDSGDNFGCVFVRDVLEGQVHVVKKRLNAVERPDTVYAAVRTEAIACSMADYFNTFNPPKKVSFVPTFVYILVGRAGQPAVRVEPYIHNFHKEPVRTLSWERKLDLDTLEAFELFTYEHSQGSFVIVDPFYVSDMWYGPACHSVDGEASEGTDKGFKGIQIFLVKHRYNFICHQLGLKNPSSLLGLRSDDITHDLPAAPSASAGEHVKSSRCTSLPRSKTRSASKEGGGAARQVRARSGTSSRSNEQEEAQSKGRTRSSSSNRRGMAGMQLEISGKLLTVLRVCRNGPAERAGLRPGHLIRMISGVAVKGKDMAAVQQLLEGKEGAVKKIVAANSVMEQDIVYEVTLAAGIVVDNNFLPAEEEEVWDEDCPSEAQERHKSTSMSSRDQNRQTFFSKSQDSEQEREVMFLPSEEEVAIEEYGDGEEEDEMAKDEEEQEEEQEQVEEELNKEELVVGRDVPILLGMRVRMLPEFMQHGTGTVLSANFLRKYVAVRWDDGWEDSCLYVGGGGEFYLRQWRERRGAK